MRPFYSIWRLFTLALKPLTLADRFLILFLVLVGSTSFIILSHIQTSGTTVKIYINNQLTYNLDLRQDYSHVITTSNGFIEVRIAEGNAWIENSSCPNKTCMKAGKIAKMGQSIVCVPNRVFIQIAGQKESHWIDAITY